MRKVTTTMMALLLIGAAPVSRNNFMPATGTASTMTGQAISSKDSCGSTPCPAAEPAITWTPRVDIIVAAPPRVMDVVFDLLKRGRPISEAVIRAQMADNAQERDAVISIVTQRYPCKDNWSSVPIDLLRLACGNEISISEISISGEPASITSGSLAPLDLTSDVQFWYGTSKLQRDAAVVGFPIVDVSREFNAAWPGHMPRMTSEFQIVTGGSRLAFAFVRSGLYSLGPDQDVITIHIYQPIGH